MYTASEQALLISQRQCGLSDPYPPSAVGKPGDADTIFGYFHYLQP